ncbi:NUDIX domain-containing protein [Nitratifractor salsuginis]|uniref:UDP-sugar diphosphatase n=1 Tax=Nitratifractor salsuginis (strain DSM 16511 / JCM 12458 / E9I37-1) TaxID=749222 RepID=E6WZ28_NITSE|nr:NUDIX domain-containing protein [Nitratifractor salsuginis]ADV45478.1 UDP-sugar diphosphatase [Nitratifractor salsuginis DSM 16511]
MTHTIEDFHLEPLKEGKFIHPHLARYRQDGEAKSWEVLEAGDSVAILIWHREHGRFVLVRQFRPAVYLHNKEGMTIELCAGLLDKEGYSPEAVAAEEVEEECGFRVRPEALEKITSFYTSVGFAGSRQTLYYVEVEESMRIGPGGGVPGEEQIEVLELSPEEARRLMEDEGVARTPGLLYALCWWFARRSEA